ncbi:glutaredoxin family protein [Thermodesulfovibrio sp. 3907-1M]|uniref:Glutaredoxin family protein n=1 Tax=Thermodesulfovibrio autotrophicus TaxID=3118333 RepID=A0AAU8GUE5_9BACT
MHKRVRLYSLSTCPVCKKVKEFLKNNSVEYDLIEVDTLDSGEQWLAMKELKKINHLETFPTVVVETAVVGFDEESLRKILELNTSYDT